MFLDTAVVRPFSLLISSPFWSLLFYPQVNEYLVIYKLINVDIWLFLVWGYYEWSCCE